MPFNPWDARPLLTASPYERKLHAAKRVQRAVRGWLAARRGRRAVAAGRHAVVGPRTAPGATDTDTRTDTADPNPRFERMEDFDRWPAALRPREGAHAE